MGTLDLRTTRKDDMDETIARLARPRYIVVWSSCADDPSSAAWICPSLPLHWAQHLACRCLEDPSRLLTGWLALRRIRCLGLLVGDFKGFAEQLDAAGHCVKELWVRRGTARL